VKSVFENEIGKQSLIVWNAFVVLHCVLRVHNCCINILLRTLQISSRRTKWLKHLLCMSSMGLLLQNR